MTRWTTCQTGRTIAAMEWFMVNGVDAEVPAGWKWFTGTGRLYAHAPDNSAGFVFTVWPIRPDEAADKPVSEEKLRHFEREYRSRCLGPFRESRTLQDIRFALPTHSRIGGWPSLSHAGVFTDAGREVGFAVACLNVWLPTAPNGEASMVVANALDGPDAAARLASDIASSCLRAPPRRS